MEIVSSPTREKYPLSTKKIVKKTIGYSLVWLVLLSIGFIPLSLIIVGFTESIIAGVLTYLILMIIVVLLIYLYEVWYFKVYYYDLNEDYIVIRKGPITPREITIPYERVQDVYVDQDILDRILGIYDVHLSSATISSGMAAHIDGVVKQYADGLREELLRSISSKIAKARGGLNAPAPAAALENQ